MHRVILHGSCRADGRSAVLADELFNACIEECPEDGVSIVSVSSTEVRPCIGCDECRAVAEEPIHVFEEGDPLLPQETVAESGALFHHCIIDDDMNEVRKHLDAADELIVVCPVYFASVPAQMKALLDRLQPYYFTDLRTRPKRPAVIHVVGAGGDPHGFEPLIGTVRSALAAAVAGFLVSGYLLLCEKKGLSSGFRKISAAALITLVCIVGCSLLGIESSHSIIGTLMILTPGIAFTMGIRDFVQGDYLSGTIRMIDALLIAASIAIGTGLVLSLTSILTGVTVV